MNNVKDLVTLFGTIFILSKNKGVAVMTHVGGHIHNLGLTFYTFLIQIWILIEYMVL